MPSGRRISEPVPLPSASGSPPSSAAAVVIMIGRKRSTQRLVDRVVGRTAFAALSFEREVDHHDGVFLDDAYQQDDADERDHAQLDVEKEQRENCADAGRGQRRENRDRMDVTLVQNAEHDVHSEECEGDEEAFVLE